MRVTGELEIDTIMCRDIGEVRLMGQQDGAVLRGNSSQCLIEIRTAFEHIINSSYPDACSCTLNVEVVITQDGDPVHFQRSRDCPSIVIVISEDAKDAQRSTQVAQYLGTRLRMMGCAGVTSERGHRDVIAGQCDEVGLLFICGSYRISNELSTRLRIMMKVAEVGNGKPVKLARQARQPDLGSFKNRPTRLDQRRISGNAQQTSGTSACGNLQESASR
jgi:hypothetical protein